MQSEDRSPGLTLEGTVVWFQSVVLAAGLLAPSLWIYRRLCLTDCAHHTTWQWANLGLLVGVIVLGSAAFLWRSRRMVPWRGVSWSRGLILAGMKLVGVVALSQLMLVLSLVCSGMTVEAWNPQEGALYWLLLGALGTAQLAFPAPVDRGTV